MNPCRGSITQNAESIILLNVLVHTYGIFLTMNLINEVSEWYQPLPLVNIAEELEMLDMENKKNGPP